MSVPANTLRRQAARRENLVVEPSRERLPEPLSTRRIEQAGFQIHATVFKITVGMAVVAWLVMSVVRGGLLFPFPLIPMAIWGPFVGLHAAFAYRAGRDPSDDEPLRLPWSTD